MTTGPIKRIARERLEQRQNVKLPVAWIGLEHTPPVSTRGQWLSEHSTEPATCLHDAPVLIMFATPSGPAYEALLTHGRAGARVYVLAPAGWEPRDGAVTGCSKVLVRRLPEVPATGVQIGSDTHLWIGADPGGVVPWCLRLGADQASAFRQVFLRLFWHEATDEAFSGGKHLSFREVGARPFDVPELTDNAPVRLISSADRLTPVPNGGLTHLTTSVPSEGQPSHLWLTPSGDHHGALTTLIRGGAQVRWRDQSLPDLTVDGSSGVALLPGIKRRLHIELTCEQAADARALLRQDGSWNFQESIRLGDHAHDGAKIWLKDAATAQSVKVEQTIAMSEVQAMELRATPSTTPSSWPDPQPLALTTRYRWTVIPPRVPSGARDDALVGRWDKVDKDWAGRLSDVRSLLETAEGNQGRIGRTFSRLVSAMMGFERTQSSLLGETKEMQQCLSPSEAGDASAMFIRLEGIEEQTKKLTSDLEQAEHKVREDEEREKQEQAWRQEVEAARAALPEYQVDLDEAETKLIDLDRVAEELEAESEGVGLKSKEMKMASKTAKEVIKKAKRNLHTRHLKLKDERTRQGGTVRRLKDQNDALLKTVSKSFTFRPPTQPRIHAKSSDKRFVPTASTPRHSNSLPDEALPEVGNLRSCKGKRYLVIESWEDLELGEQAAIRLNAMLVAPEDA